MAEINLSKDKKETSIEFLKQVEKLASEGQNQKQIAKLLGFKTTFTLNNRLVKASQITGTPVPPFKQQKSGAQGLKRVDEVEVKRRGKGDAFGVNIPQEPLMRGGFEPGDKLKVNVRRRSITVTKEKA